MNLKTVLFIILTTNIILILWTNFVTCLKLIVTLFILLIRLWTVDHDVNVCPNETRRYFSIPYTSQNSTTIWKILKTLNRKIHITFGMYNTIRENFYWKTKDKTPFFTKMWCCLQDFNMFWLSRFILCGVDFWTIEEESEPTQEWC